MWRNGRRNGLKIAVLAISALCTADQSELNLPGQIAQIHEFLLNIRGRAEMGSLLHKFLHTDATDFSEFTSTRQSVLCDERRLCDLPNRNESERLLHGAI
jgi:hypothetical protein